MHFRVAIASAVLGRTGRSNQGGVLHCALLEHQAFVDERGVDGDQDSFSQLMLFEQMAKAQDAYPIRDALRTAQTHKLPLEQSLFHDQVRPAKPLFDEVDAQHGLELERGPASLAQGACGAISASSSDHGTTRFISSRNSALRVLCLLRFRPRSCCFMGILSGAAQPFKLLQRQSY